MNQLPCVATPNLACLGTAEFKDEYSPPLNVRSLAVKLTLIEHHLGSTIGIENERLLTES